MKQNFNLVELPPGPSPALMEIIKNQEAMRRQVNEEMWQDIYRAMKYSPAEAERLIR